MKKNHSFADKTKKNFRNQRQSCKKSPFKDLNSQELSNKKLMNFRRKSEEIFKKTPSHREMREQKHSKKKSAHEIMGNIKVI